jgi:hypothetical protein
MEKTLVRNQIPSIGENLKDIIAWARTRRPDVVAHLEQLAREDGPMMLLAIGYAAGRCSVVAALDKTPIEEVARDW